MSEVRKVHFTVDGEFITNIAREKLFYGKDLAGALRILKSATVSDQLNPEEHLALCLYILNGDAGIKGNSDTDDYGVEFKNGSSPDDTVLSSIAQLISDMAEEIENLKEENQDNMKKISFLADKMSDYELMQVNGDYYNETGDYMFSGIACPAWMTAKVDDSPGVDIVQSFLEQRRREKEEDTECDYGWLEPDGTFHPVEWGQHSQWATEWLEENMPYKSHPEIYQYTDSDGSTHQIFGGDVLIHSLRWILLDNPYQGLAQVRSNPVRDMTKEQREFLYDYFIERNRMEEANALYEEPTRPLPWD